MTLYKAGTTFQLLLGVTHDFSLLPPPSLTQQPVHTLSSVSPSLLTDYRTEALTTLPACTWLHGLLVSHRRALQVKTG